MYLKHHLYLFISFIKPFRNTAFSEELQPGHSHGESEQSSLHFYLSFAITEEDSHTQRIFDPKYVNDYEVFLNK